MKDCGVAPNYLRLLRIRRELSNQGYSTRFYSAHLGAPSSGAHSKHVALTIPGLDISVADTVNISKAEPTNAPVQEEISDEFIEEIMSKIVQRYAGLK